MKVDTNILGVLMCSIVMQNTQIFYGGSVMFVVICFFCVVFTVFVLSPLVFSIFLLYDVLYHSY